MDFYTILQIVTIENFYGRDVVHKTFFYTFHNFHLIVKSYVEWCNEP